MSSRLPRWIALAVPALGLLAFVAAAEAGFGAGPAAPIDPVRFPAVGEQGQVAAADNGAVTLFAWRDTRHAGADLFLARVTDAGGVLDPNGIELAGGPGLEGEPAVAWDGLHWLVTWTDVDAGTGRGTVRAERVGVDGQPADPAPLALSTPGADAAHAGVAWNGAVWIVVWQEVTQVGPTTERHVLGATLDAGGNVLAAGAPVTETASDSQPAIAANGPNALVVFTTARAGNPDIYCVRLTAALPGGAITRLDASDLALVSDAAEQDRPAVAGAGTNWLVAWNDARNPVATGLDVYGGRVSGAGAALDAAPIVIADAPGDDHDPALTWDGSQWLATWTGAGGQFARAVTSGGSTPGGVATVSSNSPLPGDGAWGGDPAHAIVAWTDPGPGAGQGDLLARRIETGLAFGLAFPLATQTPNQTEPTMAFGAGHWFLAWVDDRFGAAARQVRVGLTDSARFEPPNPATVGFAVPRPGLDQGHPSVVYDGTNFNLFWDESRGGHTQVMGARFTAGGAFIDTFVVAGGAWNQYEPVAVAYPDGHVHVVWTDSRAGVNERDLWAAEYVGGAPAHPAIAIAQVAGVREEHPTAALLGNYATQVAYETSSGGLDRAIESVSFDEDLSLATPSHLDAVKAAGHTYQHPSLAGNGQDQMLAYEEVVFSDGPALHVPRAVRYDSFFGSWYCCPAPLDAGSYTPANPVVGSGGYDYANLWSTLLGGGPDVELEAVDPYETSVDPGAIRVTNDAVVETPGAVAQGQGDRLGFSYLRALADDAWNGLQLMGGDARDTLAGEVLINEFLAHPASDRAEFFELFNTSGRSFFLNGWSLRVNGVSNPAVDCTILFDRKGPGGPAGAGTAPLGPASAGGGPVVAGNPCGTIESQAFLTDSTFAGFPEDPIEGFLPDRGAVLELVSPGGVLVDRVGYGYKGGAPVSGAIPKSIAPASLAAPVAGAAGAAGTIGAAGPLAAGSAAGPVIAATGDSTSISTARLPNGTDTGSNATDFNLTGTTTPNSANTGTTSALGTALFVTRAYWYPLASEAVVELYNPSTSQSFDFSGWYLSNNSATEQIGIAGNAWSVLTPQDKRILRGGERGSFTFHMDELSVLYLMGPDFTRYEQLGWSRPDDLTPDLCVTRVPDTGGFHDGFDWFSCGGQDDINSGEIRYTTCSILAPPTDVPPQGAASLSFAGAWPNPARARQLSTLVFTLPGAAGGAAQHVSLALYDVAGRRVSTLVDALLPPGEHRVPMTGASSRGRVLRAGTYYAQLVVGERKLRRTVVLLP